MDIYSFILQNREIFKLIYAIFIVLVCVVIVLKTNRLYHLSFHSGIRYFRNAFLFYGLAFFSRYLLGFFVEHDITNILFEFFIVVAGFFLLYSLLWKKMESGHEIYSSIFNSKLLIFYFMAIIIAIIDLVWATMYVMFFSQIILFFFVSILSFIKFKNRTNKAKFPGFHFLAMVIMFFAWLLNSLAPKFFLWNPIALINIYLLNAVFFMVFLFGVVNISRG